MRRYYYVTPTSYLQLITAFKTLLQKKNDDTDQTIFKFEKGLKQLKNAQTTVNQLKLDLQDLEPKLEQAAKDTADLIQNLQVQEAIVAEKRKEVEAETVVCKQKSDNAS